MTLIDGVATDATTARALLFGGSGGQDTSAEFERSLTKVSATAGSGRRLGLLSAAGRTMVDGQLPKVADHLFDIPLGEALRRAWATHRRLIAAARHTMAEPGSEEVVELDSHSAKSSYHPYVQVLVDEEVVRTVVFDLVLDFEVQALLAIVRGGELVAFRTGNCVVTATLSCEGFALAGPRKTQVVFPGTVWLKTPFRLVSAVAGADRQVL
jgi:hypothetical protein